MQVRDHNPHRRRLHLPIVGTNGVSASDGRKPPWLKVRLGSGANYRDVRGIGTRWAVARVWVYEYALFRSEYRRDGLDRGRRVSP